MVYFNNGNLLFNILKITRPLLKYTSTTTKNQAIFTLFLVAARKSENLTLLFLVYSIFHSEN